MAIKKVAKSRIVARRPALGLGYPVDPAVASTSLRVWFNSGVVVVVVLREEKLEERMSAS